MEDEIKFYQEEFDHYSLEQIRSKIIEYQKTRDHKLFEHLLIRFDNYLNYLISLFKKKFEVLYEEEDRELYQISVIGFHNSLLSMRPDIYLNQILLLIGSYVKAELRKEFRMKKQEMKWKKVSIEEGLDQLDDLVLDNVKNLRDKIFLDILLTSYLSPEEQTLIKERFFDELTIEALAKKYNKGNSTIVRRLNAAIQKLKRGDG